MTAQKDLADENHALYANAVKDLLDLPTFRFFIAYWLGRQEEVGVVRGPITRETLDVANFRLGTQSFMNDFVGSIQQVSETQYKEILDEVKEYGSRRHAAIARDRDRDPG